MKIALLAAAAAALLGFWLIAGPSIRTMHALGHDGETFGALHKLRAEVAKYYEQTGRPPADLSEVFVPSLAFYCYKDDRGKKMHGHRRNSRVTARPGLAAPRAEFLYPGRAREVYVEGDFGEGRTRLNLARDKGGVFTTGEQTIKAGRQRFTFVADGQRGESFEADISYAAPDPGNPRLYPPAVEAGDTGGWLYDPESGWVGLGCTGVDTKHRRRWMDY